MSPFPKALADAQRASVHGDLLDALDRVEAIRNGLRQIDVDQAHLLGLDAGQLAELRQLTSKAYKTLHEARTITETNR